MPGLQNFCRALCDVARACDFTIECINIAVLEIGIFSESDISKRRPLYKALDIQLYEKKIHIKILIIGHFYLEMK